MAQESFGLPQAPAAGSEAIALQIELNAEAMVARAREAYLARNPGRDGFLSDLVASDDLILKGYIDCLEEAYDTRRNAWPISQNAYRVSQREVAYLNREQMQESFLGTNNLQQCVAVIIHGTGKDGQPLLALAHVDRYTTPESLDEVFDHFNSAKVILYGARDDGALAAVSHDNVEMVTASLRRAQERGFQLTEDVSRRLGAGQTPSSDIIYNHRPLGYAPEIFVGSYPDKDAQHSRAFQQVRWAHDTMQGYNPSDPHIAHGHRNATLTVKSYDAEPELSRETALYLLDNYSKYGLHAKLVSLNNSSPQKVPDRTSRSEFATREFIPHVNSIQKAFRQFGNDIDIRNIYGCKEPIKQLAGQVFEAERARHVVAVEAGVAPHPAAAVMQALQNERDPALQFIPRSVILKRLAEERQRNAALPPPPQ